MMDGQDKKENVWWKKHEPCAPNTIRGSQLQFPGAARSNDSGVARTFLWHRRGQNSPESRYHQLASAQPDLIIPNCFITGNCVGNEHQSVSPRDDLHWGSPMTQAEVKN